MIILIFHQGAFFFEQRSAVEFIEQDFLEIYSRNSMLLTFF